MGLAGNVEATAQEKLRLESDFLKVGNFEQIEELRYGTLTVGDVLRFVCVPRS